MSRGTTVVKAVMRKDFLQLWPVVALCAVILFIRNISFPFLAPAANGLRVMIEIANGLACCTLLVAVIQQDALTGVRHDWFTRPVSRGSLLAAKAIFIVLAITVPADLSLLVGSLVSGHSFIEALSEGAEFSLNWIAPLLMLAAVATLSNTLLKAAAMTLAAMAAAAILIPLSGAIGVGDNRVYGPDVGWIAESFYLLILMTASAIVLWLQYAQRNFQRAAVIAVIAMLVALCGPAYISWSQVFAVQKLFSSPKQEQRVETALASGCFPRLAAHQLRFWGPDRLRRAGPDPIGFSTTLEHAMPAGWLLNVDAVKLDYVDNTGRTLTTLQGVTTYPPESKFRTYYWLLPRATYNSLRARNVQTRLTYSLSALEPSNPADIEADGSRRYIEGIGFCGARVAEEEVGGRGWAIKADCLKRGPQRAMLSAVVKGNPMSSGFATSGDYRPSFLELLAVRRTSLPLWSKQPSPNPTVTLTSYEPRVHVDRTFTVPGILGGEQCTAE